MAGATTAILFPGQGSLHEAMRERVTIYAAELHEAAVGALGVDPFDRLEDGNEYVQPALYLGCIAEWRRLPGDMRPDASAGHSLGEIAALAAAGSITPAEGLRLVSLRGRLTEEAARAAGDGGMVALGMHADQAGELAGRFGLTIANDNSPRQVVVTGESDALDAVMREARESGTRAARLAVKGAFHSRAMDPVVDRFRAGLDEVDFGPPEWPVWSCVTAAPFDRFQELLAEALRRPVRWRETVMGMRAAGVERFVEASPRRVLTKLVRHTLGEVDALTVDDLAPVAAHG